MAPLSFYDGKAESLTIKCTATFTALDGTVLTVNATAQPITVLKPIARLNC